MLRAREIFLEGELSFLAEPNAPLMDQEALSGRCDPPTYIANT